MRVVKKYFVPPEKRSWYYRLPASTFCKFTSLFDFYNKDGIAHMEFFNSKAGFSPLSHQVDKYGVNVFSTTMAAAAVSTEDCGL